MQPDLLDPRNDYVFKRLFAEAPALLVSLINAVRRDRVPVESVLVRNPLILPSEIEGPVMALDLRATDVRGRVFDVEIRMHRRREGFPLSERQLARMLMMQIAAAAQPSPSPDVVAIHLLDFDFFDRPDRASWCFELFDEQEPSVRLDHLLELNLLELGKAAALGESLGARAVWATLLTRRAVDPDEIAWIVDPAIRAAWDRLLGLSLDEHDRYRAEVRDRAVLAEATRREAAAEKGREEGRAVGRLEGAARLLRIWLTQRFGDLSEDVIARLDAADWDTLMRWSGRVCDGATFNEVFAEV